LEKGIREIQEERKELAPILEVKRQEENEYRQKYLKLFNVLRTAQQKLQEVKVKQATLAKTVVKSPDITSFVSSFRPYLAFACWFHPCYSSNFKFLNRLKS
jgi:hypothetical protein